MSRYGVYRVKTTHGSGKSQKIVPGELLLEEQEIEDVLTKGRKVGGRTVTIRHEDQKVMAHRLVAPQGKLREDDADFVTGLRLGATSENGEGEQNGR